MENICESNSNRTMTDSDDVGSASEFSARVILDGDALAAEIVLEIVDELQLLLDREPTDDRLKHRANSDMVFADKARVVDIDKHTHQKLAVHSIGHAPVSWNTIPEVFDVEGTLETRSKEAAKGSDQRSEACHEQRWS